YSAAWLARHMIGRIARIAWIARIARYCPARPLVAHDIPAALAVLAALGVGRPCSHPFIRALAWFFTCRPAHRDRDRVMDRTRQTAASAASSSRHQIQRRSAMA